jgi:hypothetical protein
MVVLGSPAWATAEFAVFLGLLALRTLVAEFAVLPRRLRTQRTLWALDVAATLAAVLMMTALIGFVRSVLAR